MLRHNRSPRRISLVRWTSWNWIDKHDVNVAFACIVHGRFKFVLPSIFWWLILILIVDVGSRYLKSGVKLVGIRPGGHFRCLSFNQMHDDGVLPNRSFPSSYLAKLEAYMYWLYRRSLVAGTAVQPMQSLWHCVPMNLSSLKIVTVSSCTTGVQQIQPRMLVLNHH